MWLVRNEDGSLSLFYNKPVRKTGSGYKDGYWIYPFFRHKKVHCGLSLERCASIGEDLTWKDEPKKVFLVNKRD